jgi:hypothetical protein
MSRTRKHAVSRLKPVSVAAARAARGGAYSGEQETKSGEAVAATTRRLRAVSEFLLDHPPLLVPLASGFRERLPIVESAIHGSSMAPAIPPGARLRIRLLGQQPCQPGDVAYYWAHDGYTVHRVVYRARRGSTHDYLLTCGDNRLAPDPPVPSDRVLGTVIAVETDGGWRGPGPAIAVGPPYRRAIRALTVGATVAALWFSAAAAGRLAMVLLTLEAYGRARAPRWRQRFRRNTAEH